MYTNLVATIYHGINAVRFVPSNVCLLNPKVVYIEITKLAQIIITKIQYTN